MNLLFQWLWRLLPANPVLVQVVQGGSRRRRHWMVRSGYLGVMILFVMGGLLSGSSFGGQVSLTDLAKAGTHVFVVIAYAQVILICLLAPIFMAGAITAEQSSQTLNILLTTPLSNVQIVLGSLMGRLFFIWALLLSGLPLFAVLLIFGGVPISSVFVVFVVAALAALLMGSVAVTLAVTRLGGKKAVVMFVIAVAGYLVAAFLADRWLLRPLAAVPDTTTWLTPLHPLLVLEASLMSTSYHPPDMQSLANQSWWVQYYLGKPFATFCWLTIILSSGLILFSATQVRRLGDEQWCKGLLHGALGWLHLRPLGAGRTRPSRTVWQNPIAWREASTRSRGVGRALWRWAFPAISVFSAIAWLGMYHVGRMPRVMDGAIPLAPDVVFRQGLLVILILQIAVLTLVAVYMSASSISREREDHTLDLILTTTITPKAYIWGKLRGLVSFLSILSVAPILTMGIVAVYGAVGASLHWATANTSYNIKGGTIVAGLMLPEAPIVLAMLLIPFVAWCVAVGVSWSITRRGIMGSLISAGALVFGMALVLGLCGGLAVGQIPLVGVMVNVLSPATNVVMILNPYEQINSFASDGAPYLTGRLVLFGSAILGALIYLFLVYIILSAAVKNFTMNARRLSE